jgi:hypothetical protein
MTLRLFGSAVVARQDQFCPLVYQSECCCDFAVPDESGERAREVSAHYQRFMFKAAVKNYGTA